MRAGQKRGERSVTLKEVGEKRGGDGQIQRDSKASRELI